MIAEVQHTEPSALKRLAQLLGTELKDWRLDIPEQFGKGYCTGYVFNEHIRMLILNYELNEHMVIENPDVGASARTILFKFQNVFAVAGAAIHQIKATPSVLIATRRLNTEIVIPIHSHTATINIEVDAGYLKALFYGRDKSPVLQSLLQNTQPLLFEQMIYPSLQTIINEIVDGAIDETFKLFFLRIKAEELVCRLLMELEKRDESRIYDLNINDVQTLYKIKNQMLEHLETPPLIKNLAVSAGMSPSKLKRLFKQIFGISIFNYYQQFRMKEAALLLKNEKLSVADVGYRLGFTNMGHFSRVFKNHNGMKPKQYSRVLV